MRIGRRARRLLIAAALAVGGAGLLVVWSLNAYRGMTLGLWNHLRHASFGESRNLARTLSYWIGMMESLEVDPATGLYGFQERADDRRSAFERGRLAWHRGDFTEAVALLEAATEEDGDEEERLFWLAMSRLRLAESVNCREPLVARIAAAGHLQSRGGGVLAGGGSAGHGMAASHQQHAAACSLPLLTPHRRADLARAAAADFQRLLDAHDPDDRVARWLLNFSAMAAGDFPDGVPDRYRVGGPFIDHFYGAGRRRAEARHPWFRFTDRAAELGVAVADAGRGVAVEDFDGDGWLDLVTGSGFGPLRYFANDRGGRFVDRTRRAGLAGIAQTHVITAADYDGDGWMDLFVGRPFHHYLLLRNRGDGSFADVTEQSGLLAPLAPGQRAATWVSAWGDIDGDGDLDLFLAQWAFRMPGLSGPLSTPRMDPVLFVNDRGRFRMATEEWGLGPLIRDQYYIGAAFGDADGDGDADLFLSSPLRRTSVLLENHGGRFRRAAGYDRGESGFVAAFVDVDHDGRLDLFQSGFASAASSIEQSVFGEHAGRFRTGHSTILHQQPDGRFTPRDDWFGDMPMGTMGASYGDLDNDGCHDFYLGTGNPEGWFVLPNLLYLGEREGTRCTGRLDDVSMLDGFGTVQKGHGIVFFDFDRDGDQDVYSALGGMWPGDGWPNQLFVNESDLEHRWVELRLRGRQSNRFGVGSRLRIEAVDAAGEAIVRTAHIDNRTGFGSAPYLAHVGLGDAVAVREVEVWWLGSGCHARYAIELDAASVLDEAACWPGGPSAPEAS